MKLTPAMRTALDRAKREDGLRRVHNPTLPGRPPWPAHHSTIRALERHELLDHQQIKNRNGYAVDLWTITPAGREALERPNIYREVSDERVMRGGAIVDYEHATTMTSYGERIHVRAPLAKVDPDTLDPSWRRRSERDRTVAQDRKQQARRLARNVRRAA